MSLKSTYLGRYLIIVVGYLNDGFLQVSIVPQSSPRTRDIVVCMDVCVYVCTYVLSVVLLVGEASIASFIIDLAEIVPVMVGF